MSGMKQLYTPALDPPPTDFALIHSIHLTFVNQK